MTSENLRKKRNGMFIAIDMVVKDGDNLLVEEKGFEKQTSLFGIGIWGFFRKISGNNREAVVITCTTFRTKEIPWMAVFCMNECNT